MLDLFNKISGLFVILVLIVGMFPKDSDAIPAFARKNNIACSSCHTAWPMLNNAGRRYKENGYRFSEAEMPRIKVTDNLKWDESLPVSVVLVARPYDKKDTGERKFRALHEAELMVAGPMGEKMSGFFEIEAEDEFTNNLGLDVSIPAAILTYNHSEAVNLQFSYADALWFDSYNTYSHARRLTRGSQAVISNAFGGADNNGSLNTSRQNIALYGRPVDSLFYGVSMSGVADDAEGVDGQTMTARLAYEFTPDIMLGAMIMDGTCTVQSGAANCAIADRDYTRTSLDVQATVNNLVLTGAYLNAEDDNTASTAQIENTAFFVQATYIIGDGGRATWVPLVRYDVYEKNNGAEDIKELTATVSHYFTENIQGFIEFWNRSGDGTTLDDDRLTLQLMAAF